MRRRNRSELLKIVNGSKFAASSSTVVVFAPISVSSPPMIPAMPDGPSASHTSAIDGSSARSVSSSVVIRSPSCALRTTIRLPRTSSRSNAWSG